MYRTAVIRIFDVMDTIFVNVRLTEYEETPGTAAPEESIYSTTIQSLGDEAGGIWLWRSLQALQQELDHRGKYEVP